MRILLTLGCWGRTNEGFCSCKGIENHILDLTAKTDRNAKILDYLDDVFKLFDKPLYNNIHTAIWNIQDKFSEPNKPVFDEKKFRLIEGFCIEHAKCGLYLMFDLKE